MHRPASVQTSERTRSRAGRSTSAARRPFFTAKPSDTFFPGGGVQPKLRVGSATDPLEREADEVGEEVAAQQTAPSLQRMCTECADERQRQTPPPAAPRGLDGHTSGKIESSRGGGQPLPAAARGGAEAVLGSDLSAVRVHTDEAAADLNTRLGANAFTYGRDIYFARGQFVPDTREGRRLLGHELTHVIQQGGAAAGTLQADLAIEPPNPAAVGRTLTQAEMNTAIAFNTRTITDAAEIGLLRGILGLSSAPATIDEDFIRAVVEYQADFNLTQDGQIGPLTRRRLSNEILAEARSLGFPGVGAIAAGIALRTEILGLINAGDLTYATYRTRVRAASLLQRDVVLADEPTLRALRGHLPWNNFARCVELLGRRAPNHAFLIAQTIVRNALQAAWTASNPGLNPPLGTQHEEGGWVYLNLITNNLAIRRQAAGANAGINLAAPPILADSIVVAKFHTHPNLRNPAGGPLWIAGPSGPDTAVDATHGVPDIIAGTPGVDPAVFQIFASGPDRRAHLAGNQGLPGAAGGLAPQGTEDDASYDEP